VKDYGTYRRHIGAFLFEFVIVCSAVVALWRSEWLFLGASLLALILSFAPLAFERLCRVRLPALIQAFYAAFIFAAVFAGKVYGMYIRFPVWDDIVHIVSGLLVGLGIMLWLTLLVRNPKTIRLPAWLQVVVIFCIAACVAVVWEIIEFTSDHLFGTFLQRDDLADNMLDLVYGTGGGLVMAMLYTFHLRMERVIWLSAYLRRFSQGNH
jgi:hypothetical protein